MADIFISYASEDRSRVETLAKTLEEQGWDLFWDRTIPIAKAWREVIYTELSSAKCVVVIWTENSKNSKWVLAEVNEAYEKNILAQILFDNTKIPFPFRQEQAADLRDWKAGSDHSGFDLLISALSEIVGIPTKFKEADQKHTKDERELKQEQEKLRGEEQKPIEAARKSEEERKQKEAEEEPKRKDLDARVKPDKLGYTLGYGIIVVILVLIVFAFMYYLWLI